MFKGLFIVWWVNFESFTALERKAAYAVQSRLLAWTFAIMLRRQCCHSGKFHELHIEDTQLNTVDRKTVLFMNSHIFKNSKI